MYLIETSAMGNLFVNTVTDSTYPLLHWVTIKNKSRKYTPGFLTKENMIFTIAAKAFSFPLPTSVADAKTCNQLKPERMKFCIILKS